MVQCDLVDIMLLKVTIVGSFGYFLLDMTHKRGKDIILILP